MERTIEELERIGHEAAAVDLRGHGERRGEREPMTFAGHTHAIVSPLDALTARFSPPARV